MSYSKCNKCIVPNCKSGYLSCKEKVTLLSVPKSTELIKQWQSAIPRKDFVVKYGQVVCHKHFLPEDIVRKKEVKDPSGKVMASEDLKRPYLKPGRIPSIFPNCPSYLTKNTKKRKSPKKRNFVDEIKNPKRRKIFDSSKNQIPEADNDSENILKDINNLNNLKNEILETETPADFDQHESKEEREALFKLLFQNKDSLLLPVSWNRRQSNDGDFEAIELTRVITRRVANKLLFVPSKQIIIYQDLRVEIKIMGNNLDLNSIGFEKECVSSTEDIENLVNRLDEAQIRIGYGSPSSKRN
ncbi:uncharacterized protein LOC122505444 [Leptopilina heterotoma]|uniref:uncharacterized protein LOC122505444 n=1 Tax=Leptopilina heterotoma TaxID=63436 RepID=UPI001CAA2C70|nr:uncharacterized protein LOC122505444 [Leptopilina heterotoma]